MVQQRESPEVISAVFDVGADFVSRQGSMVDALIAYSRFFGEYGFTCAMDRDDVVATTGLRVSPQTVLTASHMYRLLGIDDPGLREILGSLIGIEPVPRAPLASSEISVIEDEAGGSKASGGEFGGDSGGSAGDPGDTEDDDDADINGDMPKLEGLPWKRAVPILPYWAWVAVGVLAVAGLVEAIVIARAL